MLPDFMIRDRKHSSLLIGALVAVLTLFVFGITPSAHGYHYPWDQGHDTTDPDDPEDPGPCEGGDCENDPCNESSQGSPVYLATGYFIWRETDITLKGRPNLSVSRTYNSHDPRVGLLGAGWSMSCDQGLVFTVRYEPSGGNIQGEYFREYVRRFPNGKRYIYAEQPDGSFVAPGVFDVVRRQADNTARLERQDGSYSIYGETGQLLTEVDKNGNTINYAYDAQARLTQKSDAHGRFLSYEYNTNGLVSEIQDHTGRGWRYDYDQDANLIAVTDPLGGVRRYEYSQYQPPGDGHTYSHLTRVTDESGVVETEVSYDGVKVSSYRELENTYTYQYDPANNQTTKQDSQGSQWVFTYNETGQYTRIDKPLNRTEIYDRDEDSLLTRFVDASGTEYSYSYNPYGHRLTQSDSRGTITTTYDNEKPWPLTVTSRSGRVTTLTYDAQGNPLTVTDPSGAVTRITWSPEGDIQSVINAQGNAITLNYTSQGMPLNSTDSLGRTTQYVYDSLNNTIQITNPAGEAVQYQYDVLDRIMTSIDGNGDATNYIYDGAGRLVQVTAPNSQSVQYDYDSYGRLSQRTFYDGTTTDYQYRNDNLLSQKTRPDGMVINYTYDDAKRLTQQTVGSEDSYSYAYNLRDQLMTVSNNVGTVSFTYDAFGRKTGENVNNQTTAYQYNIENEIIQLSALSIAQTQQYDSRSLLNQLDVNGTTLQYSYDNLGRQVGLNRSDLLSSVWQYDAADQLMQIDHGSGRRGYQYQYDAAGRVALWQGIAGEDRIYNYDAAGRLTEVQSPVRPESYTYDALGNRQSDNAQFDEANRLLEDDAYNYSYDTNGNRTEKIDKITGERERYSYNSLNQLIVYQRYPNSDPQTPATTDYSYNYGPLGRRWSKLNNQTTEVTEFYWSGSNLLGENSNGITRRYILEGMTPAAFIENGEIHYYLKDHLGTAHEVVDELGNTLWQGDYQSFGVVEATINSVENNLRFPGQYFDEESGNYYNINRYYDPEIGGFITSDPIGLIGGRNTYLYAMANPIMLIDRLGLETTVIVTYDYGIGSHAAVHVDQGNGNQTLYDPNGGYVPPSGIPPGSGGVHGPDDSGLQDFIDWHEGQGSVVETYPLGTTPEQDQQIVDNILDQPTSPPFGCAISSSGAIGGACGIEPTWWPGSLADQASESSCK